MSKVQVHSLSVRANGLARVIYSPVDVFNLSTSVSFQTKAIWDTGATGSAITKSLAFKLGLIPVGKANVKGVHGLRTVNVYAIKVVLNNTRVSFILKATECDSLTDDDYAEMLVGMDVITRGDFAITNYQGKTVMTYRIPSMQAIDFVEAQNKSKPIVSEKLPSRNDPCTCGSGKKFKHCHGKEK